MKKYLNSVEEVVKALKDGKKIISDFGNSVYTFFDGFIIENKANGDNLLNSHIYFDYKKNKYYTKETEPLKFEVNALYKTSKNKKAFLYKIVKGADFPNYFSSEDGCFSTDINGVFYNFGLPTNDKIVGYWEEEK